MPPGPVAAARDRSLPLILLCFFLSGFAGLLYQTAWMREFAFVFGTSELAVVAVLAAYMGGLAAGAAAGGKLAPRVRRPVLAYGVLELSIAIFALAVPWGLRAATAVHVWGFGGLAEPPAEGGLASALFYLTASFLILLPCTALMGATLPLLVRHAVRRADEIGSRIGVLYATNTAGAIAGTLVAAFALLPELGLRHTVYCGVAANALVFAAAALLSRRAPLSAPASAGRTAPRGLDPWRVHGVLAAIGLSGFTSFVYEVLWTRLLGQVLGGSVYAFATMLASFLLGIALGSAVASRLASTQRRAGWGFALAEVGIAAATLAAFAAMDAVPGLSRSLGAGAVGGLAGNAMLCALIILPSTLCIGASFPFAARLIAHDEFDAPAATAHVYAWNTVGAIFGALTAGFVALPVLGFAGTVLAGTSLNTAIAVAVAVAAGLGARPAVSLAAAGLLAVLALFPQEPWRLLRSSPWLAGEEGSEGVVYYGVGRSATVLLIEKNGEWKLLSNGLVESWIQRAGTRTGKYATERWLGALPMLSRPEARSVLVVGLGGGTTVDRVPPGVESATVVEIEAEIVEACRAIAAERARDPLSDPRVRVHVNDVRGALLLSDAHYDAILSQPSHPWTAGASHLYTREFFQLVRDRLNPEGVFVQWIGLAFVDESLARTLVATLLDVFAHVDVYLKTGELLFVASDAPLDIARTAGEVIASDPDYFAAMGIFGPEELLIQRVLDTWGARRFAEGAPVNTDDRNLMATRSPLILGKPLGAEGGDVLFSSWLPGGNHDAGVEPLYAVRRLLRTGGPARALAVARTIEDPLDAEVAMANADLNLGRPQQGIQRLEAVLKQEPRHHDARGTLLRVYSDRIQRGAPLPASLAAAEGNATEQRVLDGWRAEARGDWDAVRALDAELAEVSPRDSLHPAAMRLRVGWRVESGDPSVALEGFVLLDVLQEQTSFVKDMFLRARVAIAADRPEVVLAILSEMAAGPGLRQRREVAAARKLLEQVPEDRATAEWRAKVAARLTALAGDERKPAAVTR